MQSTHGVDLRVLFSFPPGLFPTRMEERMRKILGLVGASLVFAGPALAADLANPVYKAPPLMPVSTWAGWYLGVNAGGNWGTSDSSTAVVSSGNFFTAPFCFPPANACVVNTVDVQNAGAQRTHTSGFVGGGQIGYNWQFGNTVLGIEADFDAFRSSGTSSKTVGLVSGVPRTVTVTSSMSTDWLFTLRPRLGWVANNWLFYATGGLAVSELKPSWTFSETAFRNSAGSSFSDTKAGWAVGGGVETMFASRWIFGVEYLFVRFNDVSSTVPVVLPKGGGPAPQNFFHSADLESNIVRARLSYKF